jgi:hypothetical protein
VPPTSAYMYELKPAFVVPSEVAVQPTKVEDLEEGVVGEYIDTGNAACSLEKW